MRVRKSWVINDRVAIGIAVTLLAYAIAQIGIAVLHTAGTCGGGCVHCP